MARTTISVGKVKASYNAESVTQKIFAESTRRSVTVKIQFMAGVSHTSWISKKSVTSVRKLAGWLIGGAHDMPERPIFAMYREYYSYEIEDILRFCLVEHYKHYSYQQRLLIAGYKIKDSLVEKIQSGKLGLAPNSQRYANRKAKAGYGSTPFVATGELLSALEVVVE